MRRDYFLIGLGIRLLMLTFFLYGTEFESYNDMSQIIYDAMQNLLHGTNPYSVEYELEWGVNTFTQPFNYGPVTLILLLPAMLIPVWHRNFWVGMFIVINVYCFLTSEFLMKKAAGDSGLQKRSRLNLTRYNHDPRQNRYLYYAGMMIWILPIGTTVVTVFVYAPLFLSVLAFGYRDKPFVSALLISLAAFSYQLLLLFIPIYLVYSFKRSYPQFKSYILPSSSKPAGLNFVQYFARNSATFIKFLCGLFPAVLIFALFELWGSGGAFSSIFAYTGQMGYVKCPECDHNLDRWSIFSIPQIIYQLSDGTLMIGNISRGVVVILLTVFLFIFLFHRKADDNPELFFQWYFILAVVGFTLSNNYGQLHYLIFIEIPLLYLNQIYKPDFRKNKSIGPGIYSWFRFDKYVLKNHELPQ